MDLSPILTVSRPFLGDIYHGQIQHFQETVIGWKYRLGFGNFEVSERPAREGRNPRTGETMTIAASKTPKFKPGKALKDEINK